MSKGSLDRNEGRNNFLPIILILFFFLTHNCIQSTFILLELQDSSVFHRRQEMHLNFQETQGYRGDSIPYFLEWCPNSRRDPAQRSLAKNSRHSVPCPLISDFIQMGLGTSSQKLNHTKPWGFMFCFPPFLPHFSGSRRGMSNWTQTLFLSWVLAAATTKII